MPPPVVATVEPKYTSLATVHGLAITTRNVQSAYQQSDISFFTTRRAGEVPADASEVLVLQYGSRYFKVGTARDALPRTLPHVIAHRGKMVEEAYEKFSISEEELAERLTTRYRNARKKPPPNIYSSILTHNKAATPQAIPALNDAYGFEWTRTGQASYVTGQAALRINPVEPFTRRWPISRGNFNQRQYKTYHAVLDDLDKIWSRAINNELKIPSRDFIRYAVVLVVPDVIKSSEVRGLTELVVRQMGFSSVAFILESVAGTFGAGISAACVVDIGAQTTKVSCVEDGQVVTGSRYILPYGGDDLTKLFLAVLRLHHFPYLECNLSRALDFELMDDLKIRLCTFDEDDISSQVYEAYVRRPGQSTKVYPFKVFEERIIVPNALFESGVPLLGRFAKGKDSGGGESGFYAGENDGILYYTMVDTLSDNTNDNSDNLGTDAPPPSEDLPPSETGTETLLASRGEANPVILSVDEAICKSIDASSPIDNPERLKKFLGSLLIIGNGHKFPRLVAHLDDLLRGRFPGVEVEFVLGGGAGAISVKENLAMDAGIVAWKGGAVYAKLDCAQDAWISRRDYDTSGVRSLRDRLLFVPAPG